MEILIAGQGLAGSLLFCHLHQAGASVTVADNYPPFTSTAVAAGILIPVTGRRMVKSYKADMVLPHAFAFYSKLEALLQTQFFHHKPILELFSSGKNRNDWFARSGDADLEGYTGDILTSGQIPDHIKNNQGGILLHRSGYLKTTVFLEAVRQHISTNATLIRERVLPESITPEKNGVLWKGKKYDKVIFCEGYEAISNPFFSHLPFVPAKGEIIDFFAEDLCEDYIINNGNFILPVGNHHFKAGSTYSWTELNTTPTPSALEELTKNLTETISCKFEVTGQKAAVRPAVKDRRPYLGFHPHHPAIGIFNGLGTKGTMLGPYFSDQLCSAILRNTAIDDDVNISRYDSLFQSH